MKKYKRNQKIKHYNIGKDHPLFGKHHSEKTKKKISDNHADFSGKNHPMFGYNKYDITKGFLIREYIVNKKSMPLVAKELGCNFGTIRSWLKKYNIPIRTLNEALKGRFGKKAPSYINGRSFEPYSLEFTSKLKSKIRKRDNYTCQRCGIKESKLKGFFKKLDIHHIDYDKNNFDQNNLISLCHKCNSKVNKNRKYWKKYFKKKLKRIKEEWGCAYCNCANDRQAKRCQNCGKKKKVGSPFHLSIASNKIKGRLK